MQGDGPCVVVLGNLDMDMLFGPLPDRPEFGREVFVPERIMRPGGQGFILAAALAGLHQPVHLVTDIGDDIFGREIVAGLEAAGVNTRDVRVCADVPTGICVALLNERRDRGFVSHLAHQELLTADSVHERWGHIAHCRAFILCGYFCQPGLRPEGGVDVLRRAHDAGMMTGLDTGWDADGWNGGGRAEVRKMLPHVDLMLPNQEEAEAITGYADPLLAARDLLEGGARSVVVKLGADGALGVTADDTFHLRALPTEATDTVGAGDSFNAGLLYGLARGWALPDSMQLGLAVASYALLNRQPRYPSLENALAITRDLSTRDAVQKGDSSGNASRKATRSTQTNRNVHS